MEYVPSFPEVRDRWNRFWAGEPQRPLFFINLTKEGKEDCRRPGGGELIHGDIKEIGDRIERWADNHEFFGEAVPHFQVVFGPDHFSSFLGADLELVDGNSETSWPVHFVEDWDQTEIYLHKDDFWWNRTVECIRELRRRFDDRLIICPPHLQGGVDCLCALRGAEKLLMDLMMCPDAVHRALRKVDSCFAECCQLMAEESGIEKFGTVTRHWMYSTGNLSVPQCDFSCMISSEMFREFGLPSIACEADFLDQAVYHLDGPDAIRHLEDICTLDKVFVIQWQPGAGEAATQDWTDLRLKIDRLGKGQILGGPPEKILELVPRLENPRLFLTPHVKTRDEALRFEEDLIRIHG